MLHFTIQKKLLYDIGLMLVLYLKTHLWLFTSFGVYFEILTNSSSEIARWIAVYEVKSYALQEGAI